MPIFEAIIIGGRPLNTASSRRPRWTPPRWRKTQGAEGLQGHRYGHHQCWHPGDAGGGEEGSGTDHLQCQVPGVGGGGAGHQSQPHQGDHGGRRQDGGEPRAGHQHPIVRRPGGK